MNPLYYTSLEVSKELEKAGIKLPESGMVWYRENPCKGKYELKYRHEINLALDIVNSKIPSSNLASIFSTLALSGKTNDLSNFPNTLSFLK